MKKLFFTTIALSGMLFFVSCDGQKVEPEQEQNQEIIQETEDDLLDRIEEEEASSDQIDTIEIEESNKVKEGVTEVDIKTLKD